MTGNLDDMVEDNFVVSVQKKDYTSQEMRQRHQALITRAEQLQQEYGPEKFRITRTYQIVDAIAAVIKDKGLVEILANEGYIVEKQARIEKQQ